MFKYGHMLREGDTLTWSQPDAKPVQVKVKEIWDSKHLYVEYRWHKRAGSSVPVRTGSRWVELWTYGPDDIERPVAVVHTGDFSHWIVEPNYVGSVFPG